MTPIFQGFIRSALMPVAQLTLESLSPLHQPWFIV